MNNVELVGFVLDIKPTQEFKIDDKVYDYRVVVIGSGGSFIATTYWGDGELPDVGTKVIFTIKITSERNRKDPQLFYHKINLIKIYAIDNYSSRYPSQVEVNS